MGRETIFEKLEEYEEIFGRPIPIKYDILRLSEEHRKLDALMRRYWKDIHPLSRDLFTSFANEFQYLNLELHEIGEKLKQKDQETLMLTQTIEDKLEVFEQTFENKVLDGVANVTSQKLDDVDQENSSLREEIAKLNHLIKDKDILIQSLRSELDLIIDDSDQQIASKEKLEKDISKSLEVFDAFTKELDDLENGLQEAQRINDELKDQNNRLENQLSNLLRDKDQVILKLNRDIENLELRYQHSIEKINKLNELTPKIQNIDNFESENSGLQRKIKLMEENISSLETQLKRSKLIEQNNDDYQLKIMDLQKQNREIETEKVMLDSKLKNQMKLNKVMKNMLDKYSIKLNFERGSTIIEPPQKSKLFSKHDLEPTEENVAKQENEKTEEIKPPDKEPENSISQISNLIKDKEDSLKLNLKETMKKVRKERKNDSTRNKYFA